MRAIILAGGSGSRLHPITLSVSKQLLPVYDKPMIYYPMSLLLLAGIREILIISTPRDLPLFKNLFKTGAQLGVEISYAEQPRPEGLAQAFHIGADFLRGGPACLVLGDNILWGHGLSKTLRQSAKLTAGAQIFGYYVRNPSDYGIITFDESGQAIELEEKPTHPKSSFAIPGLYFYDEQVVDLAKGLKPSSRGELEITDLNRLYLEQNALTVHSFGRGTAWLDAGTTHGLLEASAFIEAIVQRTGLNIACLEEIAWENGWITNEDVLRLAEGMGKSAYGEYLRRIIGDAEND